MDYTEKVVPTSKRGGSDYAHPVLNCVIVLSHVSSW